MVMRAPSDRLHKHIAINRATSWSDTINASCRGKFELPAHPFVNPLHIMATMQKSFDGGGRRAASGGQVIIIREIKESGD